VVVLRIVMVVRACWAVLISALVAGSPGAAPIQGSGPRVVEITAERFEFWPTEIVVGEGEQVELRLRSEDTMHGFRIVGAGTNVLIPKRGHGYAVVMFKGTETGRYTFECSRMCGAGHNFMRGVLVVRPQRTQP
jgi:cytochrome c oxidase subunit 2